MKLTRRHFSVGLAAGIAAPALMRSAWAQGATIKIGMCAPVTGPAAESGKYAINGARLALEAVNKAGGVLGKQAELIVEDDQTTNPGIVLAFSKLAAQSDIVAFLGSIRSTQVHAMQPDVLKLGKPVMIGGTDPALTHLGNPWLFRFRPNDSYSGRVIAEYGVKTLDKKKWAIVHSTDAFGTAGGKALTEALGKLGAPPVLDQGYANQSQDFTPVVLAIKQSGADILGSYFTFENDLGIFARQLRQLGVNIPWVGSPSIVNITALKLAGPALYGTFGVADYAEDSSDGSKTFGKAYRDAYKVAPDNQSSWTFDAVTVLSAAINKAGSTAPDKVREAILATKKFPGAEGEYNFDKNGDGLHGYNIVKNDKGNIVFDKHIEFDD
ncbi:ABC transporter substrate-binding protein [Bradyrhizobium sp. U87765 SZCCT0131]|uniref:ABC transporter substrate-binding protein n=1 Tax=unclassified Bradyrhizobium TaxID=2631580 RepID=UPI001BAE4554|nr:MULTISPECIES: ABC transporter substrate-binding protein [unclassified Bradyrhizobium]MBR1221798.1 ABC transporter substrate-binding protein [Bradyrhizobium sp. U87765 SZCCT0131]MBR1264004.1 ABC transporter substrate-binding protein [Bradyrhizobium sp. U87765 SZCCT0134]MBR1308213.1 ABC transporter substrate-binding protein [Bradyrhizobium sp. U87765 SZCCT0110]MBR1320254.1 ABC transporter substrate-binding protein [Bradyrhizobium sp. U87765 SZCCT0109]MBR1348633.1 ABC transporter substrate-bin